MTIKDIKELPVEKVFLFIALFFGFIYVFLLPPFQSVDEAAHFYRSYEIVSSKIFPQKIDTQTGAKTGDYLPASLEELTSGYNYLIKHIDEKVDYGYIIKTSKIKLAPNKTTFVDFRNTALYSPATYLTQLPGMYIAKIFKANPLAIFYSGRISNLLFFCLIIYFAIKIIPFYKLPLMLLALAPMTLSLAGALTSDVVVISFNFLWLALLLKLIYEKSGEGKINSFHIIILTLLATILALSKDYVMLLPLIFLLPKSNFKNTKKYLLCIFSVVFFASLGLYLWSGVLEHVYSELNSVADSQQQIHFILAHPLDYSAILLKSFVVKTPRIITTMIGVLGWQDTRLDFLTYILYPILVFFAIIAENGFDFKFKKWQICLIGFDVLISVSLIFTSMYIMWSKVGNPIIMGLNGKYFTPIMLPFLLLFYNRIKINFSEDAKGNIKLIIYIFIILILASSDLSLLHRFYGLTPNLYYKI